MALPAENARYTFEDCLGWPGDERVELVDGEIFMMSPPSRAHQQICGNLFAQLHHYLDGKECEVYIAPFAVRLFEVEGDLPEDVDTVVEPDISVICDTKKLDEKGCKGAPDLIIEVLSHSTQRRDQITKLNLYQKAGVREYWIVDPFGEVVRVMLRGGNGFLRPHEVYSKNETVTVNVLADCHIDLEKIFP